MPHINEPVCVADVGANLPVLGELYMLDDNKLVKLLARRDNLLERGQDATPENICADYPELVDEFKELLESLKDTDRHPETEDGGDRAKRPSLSATLSFVATELPESSLTPEQFLQAIMKSGLMTSDEVEALKKDVPSQTTSSSKALARELVHLKKLTLYQVSVLLTEGNALPPWGAGWVFDSEASVISILSNLRLASTGILGH